MIERREMKRSIDFEFFRETCRLLMSKGSDVTSLNNHQRSPLHLAVKAGSLETVRLLLGPMLPSTLEVKDADGDRPLHIACMHNRLEILRFFLDQGADVTARNNENLTCLDVAIDWDSVEVAKTLVKHKRYVNNVCASCTVLYKFGGFLEVSSPYIKSVYEPRGPSGRSLSRFP